MRRSGLALIVASSLLFCQAAGAGTRPHYGGTVRTAMSAAPVSLDPVEQGGSPAAANLSRLIFDTLVELDERGAPQPGLAASWEAEPGYQRWQFHLRPGVAFDDGTPMTPEAVAASLRAANASWTVSAATDGVIIVRAAAAPDLPAELALARNSIAKRGAGKVHGTGPFTIAQWDPAKRLVLAAREDYWRGRPFVNSIEIELGKSLREQMISLDLGKLDVIEVAAEQARQATAEGRRVTSSLPVELVALVFTKEAESADDSKLREALALSLDRGALNRVFLQSGAEPAGGLLPVWMTGYSFVFPAAVDLDRARQVRAGLRQAAPWTLGYDSADGLSRLLAERIALNARDAGLNVQLANSGSSDIRLVRMRLPSLDSRTALALLASGLGLPQPKFENDSAQDLYSAESALLQSHRVIPLLHLKTNYATSSNLRNFAATRDGNWDISNAWLATERP